LKALPSSRLLFETSDFYTAESPGDLCRQLGLVFHEVFESADFSVYSVDTASHELLQLHSSGEQSRSMPAKIPLGTLWLQSVLENLSASPVSVRNDPELLGQFPFPCAYCGLLRNDEVVFGLLLIHGELKQPEGGTESVELLEPLVRHFSLAQFYILSRSALEKSFGDTTSKLLAINEVGELIGHLDLDTLLTRTMSLALQLTHAEVGNLMIVEKGVLGSRVEWGLRDQDVRSIEFQDHTPMVERVFSERNPELVRDLRSDPRFVLSSCPHHLHSILSIPLFTKNKSVGVLNVVNTSKGDSFEPENLITLQTVAGLASTAIENALLHKEAIERKVFEEQLRIARQIWENIMPKTVPTFANASIAARSLPATVIGGDFYDFIPLDQERLGLVIADVSGKGIPAAMMMNTVKSVLHIEAMRNQSSHEVLNVVNNLLLESATIEGFITLSYLVVDRGNRTISITNAGHNPTLIYRRKTNKCELLDSESIPLAVDSNQSFPTTTIGLEPGDCVVLYTDGLSEARNEEKQMFETAGLCRLMEKLGELPTAEAILGKLYEELAAFSGAAPQHDDMTVVVFKLTEQLEPSLGESI
jgi:phosphoserine phosphatase RsbU/P